VTKNIETVSIGNEKEPLLIIDDFLPNAESLIDFALQQKDVRSDSSFYPGMRSAAPSNYVDVVTQLYEQPIKDTFGLEKADLDKGESFYSLVATPTKKLQLPQKIPHFDQPHKHELALIHFLCSERHGGTGFYRHRASGFEYVDEVRLDAYNKYLQDEVASGKAEDCVGYIDGSNTMFERLRSVDAKFNRALIYRCSSLHSGNIPKEYCFDLDPRSGRFTITCFLHG